MMLRAFDDPDVTHVEGDVDPVRDMQIIVHELIQKDLTLITNEVDGKRKNVERGVGGKDAKLEFESLCKIKEVLESGKPVRFGTWAPLDVDVLNKRQLNTAKEVRANRRERERESGRDDASSPSARRLFTSSTSAQRTS